MEKDKYLSRTNLLQLSLALLLALTVFACGNEDDTPIEIDGDEEISEISDTAEDGDHDSSESTEYANDGEDGDEEIEFEEQQATIPNPAECLVNEDCQWVMVTAHRGYTANHPENSLAALRDAAEIGTQFVEVDVRHSLDEVLVLMHDSDVDRTTDGRGYVDELEWQELQQLKLKGGEEGNSESERIPLFSEALALARELGIMLYVDQKTDRWQKVLEEIQDGSYYEETLIRDSINTVSQMAGADEQLLVMPSVSNDIELDLAIDSIDILYIVEISRPAAYPELNVVAAEKGIKTQQDVMAAGDLMAFSGNYSGWKNFIDAGVWLLQTDMPHLLVPAVKEFNETGAFPEEGPGESF